MLILASISKVCCCSQCPFLLVISLQRLNFSKTTKGICGCPGLFTLRKPVVKMLTRVVATVAQASSQLSLHLSTKRGLSSAPGTVRISEQKVKVGKQEINFVRSSIEGENQEKTLVCLPGALGETSNPLAPSEPPSQCNLNSYFRIGVH